MAVVLLLHLLGELSMQAACGGYIISDVKVYVDIPLSQAFVSAKYSIFAG